MTALKLLLSLVPLACVMTSEPALLFRNLRVEPSLLRLSWDGYVTSGPRDVACQQGAEWPEWAPASSSHCRLSSLSLCHVTELRVFRDHDPSSKASIWFPESDPDRASAATNLSCRVHDVDIMTCRWGRGHAAPEDAQYRMFWRDASHGRDRDRECLHYDLANQQGTRLGCRVDGVAALPGHVTVMVTGGGGASCTDVSLHLQRVEILTPPALTAACNGTEAAQLRWEMRSHFHRRFQYELQINKSSNMEPEIEEVSVVGRASLPPGAVMLSPPAPTVMQEALPTPQTSENQFRVVIPGSAHFRVRAKPTSSPRFSDWSHAVLLDCDPAGTGKHGIVMAAALAVLGAGLTALGTLLLCRRLLRTKLFPVIPRVKDPGEEMEVVSWAVQVPEDPEVTRVTEA